MHLKSIEVEEIKSNGPMEIAINKIKELGRIVKFKAEMETQTKALNALK